MNKWLILALVGLCAFNGRLSAQNAVKQKSARKQATSDKKAAAQKKGKVAAKKGKAAAQKKGKAAAKKGKAAAQKKGKAAAKKSPSVQTARAAALRALRQKAARIQKNARAKKADAAKKVDPLVLSPEAVKSFRWRSIGPASMGGRIVDLEVVESNPSTFYVATASGGLFKTVNAGVTFTPLFQFQDTISIGDACVSKSNPDIIWVGTGENNGRNSVSWGDGVYKSVDGGKTWKNMGLKKTFQIGRIVVHPKNPDIVLVGALGRLWGKNEERGIFKTTDGGKTWKKVLYIDDMTGCVELQAHPKNPNVLLAAMYERLRDPTDAGDPVKRFGWGSGMFRSTDGGETWKRVTKGLPSVKLGRIGLSFMGSKPDVVFSIVESEKIGTGDDGKKKQALMGIQGRAGSEARLLTVSRGGAAQKAGLMTGDLVTKIDDKEIKSYDDLIKSIRSHFGGDKVKVTVNRGGKNVKVDLVFGARGSSFGAMLGGQAANAQSRQGKDGFQTGGVFKSTDAGQSWTRINSINPRPFYFSQVRVDPNNEKKLFVLGIRLNGSTDGGKTFSNSVGRGTHADHHAMWINPKNSDHIILGCDGGLNVSYDGSKTWDFIDNLPIGQFYHVGVDTRAPYNVYGGLQDNGSWGGPSATRSSQGPTTDAWFAIGGGDGFVCLVDPNDPNLVYYESQYGGIGRLNLKTGARRQFKPRTAGLRWNWKTPFILSNHNSKIYYCAANKVFKSLDRGNDLRAISPDLTSTKSGTSTAISESPLDSQVLYVGTDDGNLWVTTNGGIKWKRLRVKGVPGRRVRVQSIEASRFAAGRAYVAFDGHYFNDEKPYVFVTEDFGKSWKSLQANLPTGSTRVLREDISNSNLLYLGTEFGLYCSLDRGQHWNRMNNNVLPHVAIHEIAVHPTAGEIVAATHGRSLWVLDVNDLRQMNKEVFAKDVQLFRPKTATLWQSAIGRRFYGQRRFVGGNPARGVNFCYCLKKDAKQVTITISDVANRSLATIRPRGKTAGMHMQTWNMAAARRRAPGRTGTAPGAAARRRPRSSRVTPGTYLVTLDVDGKKTSTTLRVERDPEFSANSLTFEEEEARNAAEGESRRDD